MNAINPNKLHHSKWTAARPRHKERHFIVTTLLRDEEENVVEVILEAVHSRRETTLPWRSLKDDETWLMGWR
ncbi:TIGR02450 family Trp-rich protein [Halomonas aquatica]|uniref:TIGR02450 family Trp-rich protein n=1 Tax=Halomonas aquatica TaxID=3151123 RepID=A0ABV1NF98_9GAMM